MINNNKPTMLITIVAMDILNKVVILNKQVMLSKEAIHNKFIPNKEVTLKTMPTPKEITRHRIMDNKGREVTPTINSPKHMVDNIADNHMEGNIMVNNNKHIKINNTTNTLNLK